MASIYTRPRLRAQIVAKVKAGSKGGRRGQWSARKAQIAARAYEDAGGGYRGPMSKAQRDLVRWSDQDWTTADGKKARRRKRGGGTTTARYLPAKSWDLLTPAQRKATDAKKRRGKGQHVPNTAAAKRAAKAIRNRRRKPWSETYRSAGAAARIYYSENDRFFDSVRDPEDAIRDFVATSVIGGLKGRKGREIMALNRKPSEMIQAALRYVFGKNRSRRWDRVAWEDIERLEDQLAELFEGDEEGAIAAAYWRPLAAITPETIGFIANEDDRDLWLQEQARIRLLEDLEDLREALEKNGRCLTKDQQKEVKRRIREWSRWGKDPNTAPAWACEPAQGSGGFACDFPRVSGEARRLARACREGWDPDWWQAEIGTPGFPEEEEGPSLEDEREAMRALDAQAFEDEQFPFVPIEAYDADDEQRGPCTLKEAGRVLGEHSGRKRRARSMKKKTKKRRNPGLHSVAFWGD